MTQTLKDLVPYIDLGILVWLVFTWFYEGHHKRCSVEVKCASCGSHTTHDCASNPKS